MIGGLIAHRFIVNGREIGSTAPVYSIAEMSAKHAQDFDHAVKMIEGAKQAGAGFTRQNVRNIHPANGLHPQYLEDLLRWRARTSIAMGTPLSWDLIDFK